MRTARFNIAFIITTSMLLGACATGNVTSYKSTLKNQPRDTLLYCETYGAKKYCHRMEKGAAMDRVHNFLNSPRTRM